MLDNNSNYHGMVPKTVVSYNDSLLCWPIHLRQVEVRKVPVQERGDDLRLVLAPSIEYSRAGGSSVRDLSSVLRPFR